MADLNAQQRRQLDALREAYEAELPEKVTSIARAAADDLGGRAGVETLYQLVHRLAGSSAIWGFTAVSRAAGELEEVVLAALHDTSPPLERRSSEVRRLVGQLQRALRASRRQSPAPSSSADGGAR